MELESKAGYSTFRSLGKEIDILLKLKPSENYPPVAASIIQYVSGLKSAGLFENQTVDEVLSLARVEIGAELLRAKGKDRESFVQFDRTRYLWCDWKFSALDLLSEAAEKLEKDGFELKPQSEADPDKSGLRSATRN